MNIHGKIGRKLSNMPPKKPVLDRENGWELVIVKDIQMRERTFECNSLVIVRDIQI